MDDLTKRLLNHLEKRKKNQSFRVLKDYSSYIDFLSNDYLGLAKNTVQNFKETIMHGGSSRLISGSTSLHFDLERFLAQHFNSEAALLFNSGYDANIGILSTIPKKGDIVIYDELCHASIKDGLHLSTAKRLKFKHNNTSDLERLLKKNKGFTIFVVVEGLYSMDGDFAPIKEIDRLIQKYNAYLILDEAHSAGTVGKDGKGLTYLEKIRTPFARTITFGKAFGAHGAVVLCSQLTKDYLINYARSFIYTTALPASIVHKVYTNIKETDFEILQNKLIENVNLFRSFVPSIYLKSNLTSPIQIIDAKSLDQLLGLEKAMLYKGYGVKAILAPTVKEGSERLRVSIHADQSSEQIKNLGNIVISHFS